MEVDKMHLKIMVPSQIIVNTMVSKVIAEAENGSFCLLPRHIDFVAVLVPGILIHESDDIESYLAVDEGILVKNGYEVLISVLNAVQSEDLGLLEQTVREEFNRLKENEKMSRSALEKLEADFVRRFIELQEKRH
jgi:F-type H+-transporting ATPase subunit epsilon